MGILEAQMKTYDSVFWPTSNEGNTGERKKLGAAIWRRKSDVSIATPLKTNARLEKREYANKGGLPTTE